MKYLSYDDLPYCIADVNLKSVMKRIHVEKMKFSHRLLKNVENKVQ